MVIQIPFIDAVGEFAKMCQITLLEVTSVQIKKLDPHILYTSIRNTTLENLDSWRLCEGAKSKMIERLKVTKKRKGGHALKSVHSKYIYNSRWY